jgi:hypothetical protein
MTNNIIPNESDKGFVSKGKSDKEKAFVPPVFLSNGKFNTKEDHWLPSFIEDQLYLQICECDKTVEVKDEQSNYSLLNWYYYHVDQYAGRRSIYNFEGKYAQYKPIFQLYLEDFSPRLKAELAALPLESVNRIVTQAVFKIIRARRKMAFYQYIENEQLRWEFL